MCESESQAFHSELLLLCVDQSLETRAGTGSAEFFFVDKWADVEVKGVGVSVCGSVCMCMCMCVCVCVRVRVRARARVEEWDRSGGGNEARV